MAFMAHVIMMAGFMFKESSLLVVSLFLFLFLKRSRAGAKRPQIKVCYFLFVAFLIVRYVFMFSGVNNSSSCCMSLAYNFSSANVCRSISSSPIFLNPSRLLT